MSNIIGSFVFRHDGDGCITGKYFNNGMKSPLPESAKLDISAEDDDIFTGVYNSTWLDDIHAPNEGWLEIKKKPGTSGIYLVERRKNEDDDNLYVQRRSYAKQWPAGRLVHKLN
jgi:hypothetical protein